MDKILIVDDNKESVENLKEGLEKLNQFQVVTAYDGEQAMEVLERERISLLVTDIKMPKVDGLELLAYMTKKHATTPCIVMTGYGTPEIRRLLDAQGVLQYIEKPFDFRKLALAIIEGLHLLDEGKSMKGMVLRTFLPLVDLTKKSCRIEVTSAGKGKGYFYFDQGELREAHYQTLRGDQAALEMLGWDTMEIRFNDLPQGRAKGRITKSLLDLLGESVAPPRQASDSDAKSDTKAEAQTMEPDPERPIVQGTRNILTPEAEQSVPARPVAIGNEVYKRALTGHLGVLRQTKGYQGVAVLNFAGEILTADKFTDEFPLHELCTRFTDLFRRAHEAAMEESIGECRDLTIHTTDKVILICSSGLDSKVRFYTVGIVNGDGNWYYMKMELDKITDRLIVELS